MHTSALDESSAMATEFAHHLSIYFDSVFGIIWNVLSFGHGLFLFFSQCTDLQTRGFIQTVIDLGLTASLLFRIGTARVTLHVIRGFAIPSLSAISIGSTTARSASILF